MIYYEAITNVLPFFQIIDQAFLIGSSKDTIEFVQDSEFDSTLLGLGTHDELVFISEIVVNLKAGRVNQNISLNQAIGIGYVKSVSINQILSFSSLTKRNKTPSISQTLSFNQVVSSKPTVIVQQLVLSQTISYNLSKPIANQLIFQQTISVGFIRTRTITSSLGFVNGLTVWKDDPSFQAFVPSPPNPHHVITLIFGSFILILPDPEFGDTDKYEQSRIMRRNRGGELNLYRDPIWPTTETLHYQFKFLSQSQGWSLLDLIRRSIGKNIILNDIYGEDWQGIITTPDIQLVQEGRFNFSASFEFEGVRI